MGILRRSLLLCSVLAGLAACGPNQSSDDSGSATSGTTGTSSGTGQGTPTTGTTGMSTIGTTDATSMTSMTSMGSTDATETTTAATTTGSMTSDASSESGEGTTTDGVACVLKDQACSLVESFGEYEDCGDVNPWDDLTPAWQAARDCALKASKEQRGFKLLTWLQGFDSQIGQAYVGLTGESYAVSTFFFDSDPCGGQGCGPVMYQAGCDSLVAMPDCIIEPGSACLMCVGQGMSGQICGPR